VNPNRAQVTSWFFSKSHIGANRGDSKWYGDSTKYILLSIDHSDGEAVCVSRLFYRKFFDELTAVREVAKVAAEPVAGSGKTRNSFSTAVTQEDKNQLDNATFIEDYDLDAAGFADLAQKGRISATIVILTSGSFSSASQLLRLGYLRQNVQTTGFTPIPVVVGDAFVVPSSKQLDDIAKGNFLRPGQTLESVGMQYTGQFVCMKEVRHALQGTFQSRISLVDVPHDTPEALSKELLKVLLRFANKQDQADAAEYREIEARMEGDQPEVIPEIVAKPAGIEDMEIEVADAKPSAMPATDGFVAPSFN